MALATSLPEQPETAALSFSGQALHQSALELIAGLASGHYDGVPTEVAPGTEDRLRGLALLHGE